MAETDFWDEVFADLEQREDIHRIKKLILFTCHDFWADESYDLDNTSIGDLIREMLEIIPSLKNLKESINTHVKKLNKQAEYYLAADMIIDTIGPLYASAKTADTTTPEQQSKINPEDSIEDSDPVPAIVAADVNDAEVVWYEDSEYNYHQLAAPEKLNHIPRPFDLRSEIVRQVSPLQAKILLFSALHYKFNPQERDWSQLCVYILDDLLLQLLRKCDTMAILEAKLQDTAAELPNPDENRYIAAVISSAMKALYEGT